MMSQQTDISDRAGENPADRPETSNVGREPYVAVNVQLARVDAPTNGDYDNGESFPNASEVDATERASNLTQQQLIAWSWNVIEYVQKAVTENAATAGRMIADCDVGYAVTCDRLAMAASSARTIAEEQAQRLGQTRSIVGEHLGQRYEDLKGACSAAGERASTGAADIAESAVVGAGRCCNAAAMALLNAREGLAEAVWGACVTNGLVADPQSPAAVAVVAREQAIGVAGRTSKSRKPKFKNMRFKPATFPYKKVVRMPTNPRDSQIGSSHGEVTEGDDVYFQHRLPGGAGQRSGIRWAILVTSYFLFMAHMTILTLGINLVQFYFATLPLWRLVKLVSDVAQSPHDWYWICFWCVAKLSMMQTLFALYNIFVLWTMCLEFSGEWVLSWAVEAYIAFFANSIQFICQILQKFGFVPTNDRTFGLLGGGKSNKGSSSSSARSTPLGPKLDVKKGFDAIACAVAAELEAITTVADVEEVPKEKPGWTKEAPVYEDTINFATTNDDDYEPIDLSVVPDEFKSLLCADVRAANRDDEAEEDDIDEESVVTSSESQRQVPAPAPIGLSLFLLAFVYLIVSVPHKWWVIIHNMIERKAPHRELAIQFVTEMMNLPTPDQFALVSNIMVRIDQIKSALKTAILVRSAIFCERFDCHIWDTIHGLEPLTKWYGTNTEQAMMYGSGFTYTSLQLTRSQTNNPDEDVRSLLDRQIKMLGQPGFVCAAVAYIVVKPSFLGKVYTSKDAVRIMYHGVQDWRKMTMACKFLPLAPSPLVDMKFSCTKYDRTLVTNVPENVDLNNTIALQFFRGTILRHHCLNYKTFKHLNCGKSQPVPLPGSLGTSWGSTT